MSERQFRDVLKGIKADGFREVKENERTGARLNFPITSDEQPVGGILGQGTNCYVEMLVAREVIDWIDFYGVWGSPIYILTCEDSQHSQYKLRTSWGEGGAGN